MSKKGKNVKHDTKTPTKPEAGKSAGVGGAATPGTPNPPASPAPAAAATAAPVTPATPKPLIIKVLKKDATFRGARAAWYERLKQFDGKTEGEYIASTKESPPALTRNQTAENPTGWVSWFKRHGVISLQQAA